MRTGHQRANGLGDALAQTGELSARTVIFDIEPLVADWNGTQTSLDEGTARVLSETAIGDQLATDGILARRLGYTFIQIDQPAGVPAGPRLMAAAGRRVQPLLFTKPRPPSPAA